MARPAEIHTPALPGTRNATDGSLALARPGAPQPVEAGAQVVTKAQSSSDQTQRDNASQGTGKLQIERLFAVSDVHLLAPGKTMNASQQLKAEFFEAAAPPPAVAAQPKSPAAQPAPSQEATPTQSPEQVATAEDAEKKSTEPPSVATAERIWARVVLKPKPEQESSPDKSASELDTASAVKPPATSPAKPKSASKVPGSSDTDTEIRMAWLWGNVAIHQDPAPGKTEGQDASGEAMYLDNRGPGKAVIYVYQRDPTETTYLPGPLPPAVVDKMDQNVRITAAGILKVNQETDEAWADGPGTLTQLVDRGFLTDKSGDETDDADGSDETEGANKQPGEANGSQAAKRESKPKSHSTLAAAGSDAKADPGEVAGPENAPQPKMRAGRPVPEKEPMTIGFTEGMDFNGRSIDPDGRPAAQAIFAGFVTAQMEDALLHGDEKMIAYTDKVVPLAQLGAAFPGRLAAENQCPWWRSRQFRS